MQIGSRNLKFLDCSGNERAGHLVKDELLHVCLIFNIIFINMIISSLSTLSILIIIIIFFIFIIIIFLFIFIIIIIIIIIMLSMFSICDQMVSRISSIRMEVSGHHDDFHMAFLIFKLPGVLRNF